MFEIQDNNNLRSNQIGSTVSVAGNTIRFERGLITLNMPTDLISPFSEAPSTNYYIYVKDDGKVVLDPTYPYERAEDLLGKYHPYNPWRNVGYVINDGSSNFSSIVNEYYPNADKIGQSMTSVGANASLSKVTSSTATPANVIGAAMTAAASGNNVFNIRSQSSGLIASLGNMGKSLSSNGKTTTSTSYVNVTNSSSAKTFLPAAVTTGTDNINISSHGLTSGQLVQFSNSGGGLPAGLSVNTDYYVSVVDANNFKVSTTYAGGLAGTGIVDITTQGTGTHSVDPIVSFAITTAGRTVQLNLQDDGQGSGSGAAFSASATGSVSNINAFVLISRITTAGSVTSICEHSINFTGSTSSAAWLFGIPVSIAKQDVALAAGTYVYKVQIKAGTSCTAQLSNTILTGFET